MCDQCNKAEHMDKTEAERKAICKRERKNEKRLYAQARMQMGGLVSDPNVAHNPLWQNRAV